MADNFQRINCTIIDNAGLMLVDTILRQLDHVPFLLHLYIEVEDIQTNLTLRRRARTLAERNDYKL